MSIEYQPAIHFQNVSYQIDSIEILENITGSFAKGKITTLVGPSGAGKTTLLKICNGLISPTSGEIYVHDQLLEKYDPIKLRQQVGMALQHAPMIKGSVYENLALPLQLRGGTLLEKEAKVFLQDVGLDQKLLHRNVKDLSGGQRQKVSIARTLVNRPQILLLDEITSSLDPASVQEIEALIVKINQTYDVSIIWITHSLQQAWSIGHFSWVMKNGRLIEAGESELLRSPKNEEVKRFVRGESK
ncbi:phosphate ABC transporter ATP-binding protein [Bacillus sp. FJAT-50079]|uniref:ABC transporter ATP-binding protein n=1 Tax=Bacillus sp. FJAT-50079 TaxID=2833577 RepID=UPI001BC8EDDB|nr:phosphate ABC transporter ATP-binding protein [Bacillus sp. FJAT-50079]MBS4210085.1 phosphate ABC transporter ATP-binding protein [Bacillus sp. FJAT-50079]